MKNIKQWVAWFEAIALGVAVVGFALFNAWK